MRLLLSLRSASVAEFMMKGESSLPNERRLRLKHEITQDSVCSGYGILDYIGYFGGRILGYRARNDNSINWICGILFFERDVDAGRHIQLGLNIYRAVRWFLCLAVPVY